MNKKLLFFLCLLPIFPISLYAMEEEATSSSQGTLIERAAIAYEGICNNSPSTTEEHTNLTTILQETKNFLKIRNEITTENIARLVTTHLFSQTADFIKQLKENKENEKDTVAKEYLINITEYSAAKNNKKIQETPLQISAGYQHKIHSASRNKWLYWLTGGALVGGACYWAYVHGKDTQLPTSFSFSTISNVLGSLIKKATTTQHVIASSGVGAALLCGILGAREHKKQTILTKEFQLNVMPNFQRIQTNPVQYTTDEDAIEKIIARTNIQALFGKPSTKEKESDSEEEEEEEERDNNDDSKAIKKIKKIEAQNPLEKTSETLKKNIIARELEQLIEVTNSNPIRYPTTGGIITVEEEKQDENASQIKARPYNLIHPLDKSAVWQEECRKLIKEKQQLNTFIFNLWLDTDLEKPYLTFKIIKQEHNIALEIQVGDEVKRSEFVDDQVDILINHIATKQQEVLNSIQKNLHRQADSEEESSGEENPGSGEEIYHTNSSEEEENSNVLVLENVGSEGSDESDKEDSLHIESKDSEKEKREEKPSSRSTINPQDSAPTIESPLELPEAPQTTEGLYATLYGPSSSEHKKFSPEEKGKNSEEEEEESVEEKIEKIDKELKNTITEEITDNIPVWPPSEKLEFTIQIPHQQQTYEKFTITIIPSVSNQDQFAITIKHNEDTSRYRCIETKEACVNKIYSYIEKKLEEIEQNKLADELLETEFLDQLPELVKQFCTGSNKKVVYNVISYDNEQGKLILEKTNDGLLKRIWIINEQTDTYSYNSQETLLAGIKPLLNQKFIGHIYENLNDSFKFKQRLFQLVEQFIKNNKTEETYTFTDETGKQAILTLKKSESNTIERVWKIDNDENTAIITSVDDQGILPLQNFIGIEKLS